MTIGHNNPPHAAALADAEAFKAECLALQVTTKQDSAAAALLIDREVKARKKADENRKNEKQPYLDQGREVDAQWEPVITTYEDAIKPVKASVLAWLRREAERVAQEQEAARLEAERAQEAAMDALMEASSDDVWAEIEAAKAVANADQAAERAAQLDAATAPMQIRADGIRARGVKTAYSAIVQDPVALVKALANNPSVQEAAEKVANNMARAMKADFVLAGCVIDVRETL